jgi:hypothetical protein
MEFTSSEIRNDLKVEIAQIQAKTPAFVPGLAIVQVNQHMMKTNYPKYGWTQVYATGDELLENAKIPKIEMAVSVPRELY